MSLYIVQVRVLTSGTLIGYLCRGRVVTKRRNASVYTSPSAAERAARSDFRSGYYHKIIGANAPSTGP